MNNIRDEEIAFLIIMIKKLQLEEFTGSVQLNFKSGGVSNINKVESFRICDKVLVV